MKHPGWLAGTARYFQKLYLHGYRPCRIWFGDGLPEFEGSFLSVEFLSYRPSTLPLYKRTRAVYTHIATIPQEEEFAVERSG